MVCKDATVDAQLIKVDADANPGRPLSSFVGGYNPPTGCYHPVMRKEDEERVAARLAKVMAMMCVRNTKLEDIHAGVVPVTKTGDYSDVVVLDAEGRKIPWLEVSHIDDAQMLELMKEIVNRLYTFHMRFDDPEFHAQIARWAAVTAKWDEPELIGQGIADHVSSSLDDGRE